MAILITPFPIDKRDGAGWVSRRIGEREMFSFISTRRDTFLSKSLWAVIGILVFPFLHPIFCRYTPFFSKPFRTEKEVWLNFSQTFALSLFNRNCVMVCHDLQCHCKHRFVSWSRWSERLLLNRAKKVVVLSHRDATLVNRYYKIPLQKIENIGPFLMPGLHPFTKEIRGAAKRAAFLGTLVRKENREGLSWFVQHVLPACPELEVVIIGQLSSRYTIHHPRLHYLGFVDDLHSVIDEQDLLIAPLFSRAGIKIKVVETLLNETPVLGTLAAYGGLHPPEGGWCSNHPEDWIAVLKFGGNYQFNGL